MTETIDAFSLTTTLSDQVQPDSCCRAFSTFRQTMIELFGGFTVYIEFLYHTVHGRHTTAKRRDLAMLEEYLNFCT